MSILNIRLGLWVPNPGRKRIGRCKFFDPDQFDAYRYLGYEAANTMIENLDLTNKLYCLG